MSEFEITTWHSSNGEKTLIEKLPLSKLINAIKWLEAADPNAKFSQKSYPKGTTVKILLEILRQEKINRKLRRSRNLFD